MTNELFERELQNTSINDVSLADYVKENYVSRSVLEQIRDEVQRMADSKILNMKIVLELIDNYTKRDTDV